MLQTVIVLVGSFLGLILGVELNKLGFKRQGRDLARAAVTVPVCWFALLLMCFLIP